MNRNVNSRFAVNPQVDINRSKFHRDSTIKTSFNVGDVVPFYIDEVLPGDTFQIKTSKVVRLQTLITPMMDNLYLDTYYFYVPNRLVWNHWKELNGENNESAWIPQTEYQVPQITAPTGGFAIGTIADYLGVPTGVSGLSVNALPFRAYALIMNEWFRDQNLTDPLSIPVDDATVVGVNTGNYITDCAKGGLPFKAAKYHDYFTSCLPAPQKGPDVSIPVAEAGTYAVVPRSERVPANLFDGSSLSARTANGANWSSSTGYVAPLFNMTSGSPLGSGSASLSGSGSYESPIVFDNLYAVAKIVVYHSLRRFVIKIIVVKMCKFLYFRNIPLFIFNTVD